MKRNREDNAGIRTGTATMSTNTLGREMRAYDMLPAAVRTRLSAATIPIGAEGTLRAFVSYLDATGGDQPRSVDLILQGIAITERRAAIDWSRPLE